MKVLNGDEKLELLRDKIERKEHLTGEDILTLSFIPLMSSKESRSKRALQSIELADTIPEGNEKLQCLTTFQKESLPLLLNWETFFLKSLILQHRR